MNYRIEEKEGFTVVGVKKFVTLEGGKNFKIIPQMWNDLPPQSYNELRQLADSEPGGVIGVCADMYDNGFDYWIATVTTKPCPAHFSTLTVPAATWAIFEAVGPNPGAIQKVWRYIYGEWLPNCGFEHAPVPEIEWYSKGDSSSADYKSEVWVPVIKINK